MLHPVSIWGYCHTTAGNGETFPLNLGNRAEGRGLKGSAQLHAASAGRAEQSRYEQPELLHTARGSGLGSSIRICVISLKNAEQEAGSREGERAMLWS